MCVQLPTRRAQYHATVRDLLGVTSVGTGATAGLPSTLLYADFDGPMVPDAWRIYQDVGAQIAAAVMASPTLKANFIGCGPAASGCLTQTIQTFGRKAFRRPLTTDEVTRFQALGQGTRRGRRPKSPRRRCSPSWSLRRSCTRPS